MRYLLTMAALVLVASTGLGADDAPNTLTREEKTQGWKLLFDGRDRAHVTSTAVTNSH